MIELYALTLLLTIQPATVPVIVEAQSGAYHSQCPGGTCYVPTRIGKPKPVYKPRRLRLFRRRR